MAGSGGITRRRFLGAGAGIGLAVATSGGIARALTGPTLLRSQPVRLPGPPFTLGVASGDPLHDRVVLWTRLATDPIGPDGGLTGIASVPVRWQVARDERFRKVVASGKVAATPDDGFSVHVDARGLDADREYFYRFRAGDETSPVARTRTAPAPGAAAKRLRFAFSSCQNYQDGYFGAYRHLADEDLAFVAFLGDYIYESGPRADRPRQHEGPEVMDLAAYRTRYGRYKSDADLQAAHHAAPWIVTWDDHEVDNNYAADQSQNHVQTPEDFLRRRADAYKAWWEHQPVRLPRPTGPDYRIYRTVGFGRLLDLHVLDTRQYRSDQPCGAGADVGVGCADVDAPTGTLMGTEQEEWLGKALDRSKARWSVIAQQVMAGRMNFGGTLDPGIFNFDQWDGYTQARRRLFDSIEQAGRSTVVVTGDIHSSWVNDLKRDPEDPASDTIATEFVGPSVTSRFDLGAVVANVVPANPTVKYFEGDHHGYVVCDLSRDSWKTDYRYVAAADQPDPPLDATLAKSFTLDHRKPGAEPA